MKFTMKRAICIVLSLVLCAGVLSGCFGREDDKSGEITYYVVGAERTDTARIIEKMQEILLEKTGVQVNFEFLSNDAYDLTISSGEVIDLIYAPDHMNYWQNATKGAFSEITDEDLKKYAPYIWENCQDVINVSKYKGVRYGVPNLHHYAPDRCLVARGDFMDKYGIDSIDSMEDVEKYLTAVAENEKNMIPFDIPGTAPWLNFAMFASDWGWAPIGSTSYGKHVYYNLNDPERKVFIAAEQPEMLEFTKTMKRWNEKGFFSKSVLSNKTSSLDSFKAGRTALAFVNSPAECQTVWDELSKDDRANWDIRFFTRYQKSQAMYNVMNGCAAIGANTDNKEDCLKVLNEFYANKELYRILKYGFEGEHYIINDDGTMSVKEADENRGSIATGIYNDNWALETQLNFPGHEELTKKLYDMRVTNPAVNMPYDETNVREIELALSEVYNQYTTPRCYGTFKGTAEEAIAKEIKALKAAGIDKYVQDYQKQFDEYMESIGK